MLRHRSRELSSTLPGKPSLAVESYPPNLKIVRGLFADIAPVLEAECQEYTNPEFQAREGVEAWEFPTGWGSVIRRRFRAGELRAIGKEATVIVLDSLEVDDNFFVMINQQPPLSSQKYHGDPTPAKVVHEVILDDLTICHKRPTLMMLNGFLCQQFLYMQVMSQFRPPQKSSTVVETLATNILATTWQFMDYPLLCPPNEEARLTAILFACKFN